ncbi:MAG: phosphoenolpyruvate carboxykinase (ATP), partial [Chloroflexota bacterium]
MKSLGIDPIYAWIKKFGFTASAEVIYNRSAPGLLEYAINLKEGLFTKSGAFVVNTVPYTGRSPEDKYIVDDGDEEIWLAEGTQYIPRDTFDQIKLKLIDYLQQRPMFVRDVFAGAHPSYQIPVRIVTEQAWQNLAACNLFISINDQPPFPEPGFTLIAASGFEANPEIDGTRSKAFIILDLQQKIVLIGKSKYAGEIKKSIFTLMNYIMPKRDVLSLHCSANLGQNGDVALFFGLSGTGKTTLSSDPTRSLIGDDEHGWSDKGIFNFEGGCYA